MIGIYDNTIQNWLREKLKKLENYFHSDVIFYYGEIHASLGKLFRDFIEQLKIDKRKNKDILTIFLNTPDGSVETVEKMVNITRHHYKEVYFVVPDYAMSAGTIFCMSGNKIYMDYSSSLGPIDPQIFNGKKWVPALGYLDKVEELIGKSSNNKLTQAEYLILKDIDLAELRSYEMAKNLTISLLKEWLVKYKFQDWKVHSKSKKEVKDKEKEKRAKEIADILGDNSTWLSHGRNIDIKILTKKLKLKIEDYSDNIELTKIIRDYNDLIIEYISRENIDAFFHSEIFLKTFKKNYANR